VLVGGCFRVGGPDARAEQDAAVLEHVGPADGASVVVDADVDADIDLAAFGDLVLPLQAVPEPGGKLAVAHLRPLVEVEAAEVVSSRPGSASWRLSSLVWIQRAGLAARQTAGSSMSAPSGAPCHQSSCPLSRSRAIVR
jgi:hypothetical protein